VTNDTNKNVAVLKTWQTGKKKLRPLQLTTTKTANLISADTMPIKAGNFDNSHRYVAHNSI
jgi:hypothetical protein